MIEILDTTLREGEQTPYVNFTVDEKIHMRGALAVRQNDRSASGPPFALLGCRVWPVLNPGQAGNACDGLR